LKGFHERSPQATSEQTVEFGRLLEHEQRPGTGRLRKLGKWSDAGHFQAWSSLRESLDKRERRAGNFSRIVCGAEIGLKEIAARLLKRSRNWGAERLLRQTRRRGRKRCEMRKRLSNRDWRRAGEFPQGADNLGVEMEFCNPKRADVAFKSLRSSS